MVNYDPLRSVYKIQTNARTLISNGKIFEVRSNIVTTCLFGQKRKGQVLVRIYDGSL